MSMLALAHATIVMERGYNASPGRVFAAWEDVAARERWSAPTPEIRIKHEAADFREGGRDVSRCIEPGKPDYVAEIVYLDIRRDRRIVFAETVANAGARVSAALISVEITPKDAGSHLLLTIQMASFDGVDMSGGYQQGWGAALDNLALEFR